ncbi:alpha-amylase family glycosyl hydrolase [Flavobacterium sp. DGU11]|uniref:Alpha-amylase family glycosyl hydrolase n=1 Tax=Flavobacterium arundinis TaxID=3139143 RepID=A0ABU9HTK1_9FLAO
MIKKLIIILLMFFTLNASAQQEVMYHIFQRSFFDSNGDGNGDLKGIQQKLDYLQQLGVTTILLSPLYQSDFYHNYFATDFEAIDKEYGSFKDYRNLIQEVHKRKMKLYQDVEMQYVADQHPWFTDSYKNPKSQYSRYVYYNDKLNEKPHYFWDVPEFTTYNNTKEQIVMVNMKDPKVKEYTLKVLKYWIDPDGDGNFNDGVDGYRLDHMMDNLDNANKLTNLFKEFWTPILNDLRKVNPALQIVAEQADWNSYGHEYFTKGNVDRVFAFRLKQAITSFDKKKIEKAADSTFLYNPAGKQQVVFIENHDTDRFASEPGMNIGKLKIGAALNLLMGGVPSIYYGQEISMKGKTEQRPTDGGEIPIRETFEWYAADNGPGMALWYKDTGPWWNNRNMKPNDGISLEEQQKDPNSLWNYYRQLIRLKKIQPALAFGDYKTIPTSNDKVLSFTRTYGEEKILVVINLSGNTEEVMIDPREDYNISKLKLLSGTPNVILPRDGKNLSMTPYAVQVWRFPKGS